MHGTLGGEPSIQIIFVQPSKSLSGRHGQTANTHMVMHVSHPLLDTRGAHYSLPHKLTYTISLLVVSLSDTLGAGRQPVEAFHRCLRGRGHGVRDRRRRRCEQAEVALMDEVEQPEGLDSMCFEHYNITRK